MIDNQYLSDREIEELLDDLGRDEYAYIEYDETEHAITGFPIF